jgi:putative endonuclease
MKCALVCRVSSRLRFGARGEDAAADLLRSRGYRIVARNHRCPRGEIDLIAEKGELLLFVEVRTRATAAFGGPEETVNHRKQRRVVAAARDYLAQRRGPAKAVRFDVIAVIDGPEGPALTHFENAFDAGP